MSKDRNVDLEWVATRFKALGHPHRLEIFWRLASCCVPGTKVTEGDEGRRCVGELAADLDIAPSTVSHHIKELRNAGLIHCERRGQRVFCSVNMEALDAVAAFAKRGAP